MPERVVAAPRIVQRHRVGDAVLVAAPQRREARVEALVGDGAAGDDDIGFQPGDPVQPSAERVRAERWRAQAAAVRTVEAGELRRASGPDAPPDRGRARRHRCAPRPSAAAARRACGTPSPARPRARPAPFAGRGWIAQPEKSVPSYAMSRRRRMRPSGEVGVFAAPFTLASLWRRLRWAVGVPDMKAPRTLIAAARRPRAPSAAWRAAPELAAPFRVAGLDGVRAIAVTLVILFHLTPGTTIGGLPRGRHLLRGQRVPDHDPAAARAQRDRPDPARRLLVAPCPPAAARARGPRAGVLHSGAGRSAATCWSASGCRCSAPRPSAATGCCSPPDRATSATACPSCSATCGRWPSRSSSTWSGRCCSFWCWSGCRGSSVSSWSACSPPPRPSRWPCSSPPRIPNRVYYGTDTHAFGLAIGAFLALLAISWPRRVLEWSRAGRRLLGSCRADRPAGASGVRGAHARRCAPRLPRRPGRWWPC